MPSTPYARPVALPSLTSSPKTKHGRGRSSSGSSSGSSSRSLPAFPTLSIAGENVLEANASDILWKTFVAFEQDCRETPNLSPLISGIEATVAAAMDPISLAGDALNECATYVQTEVRDNIEQALAGPAAKQAASASPRPQASTASHSKQLTLASTRISGACSSFRATQTSLRFYGGARKTAYQLDLFIHKYALPTSTALHKRGQEYSAASKWLKKVLAGEDRLLDAVEMAALRRASNTLMKWAEGLRAHANVMKQAASSIRHLMAERASLTAYTFPLRMSPTMSSSVVSASPGMAVVSTSSPVVSAGSCPAPSLITSPMSEFTNLSMMTPTTAELATYTYLDQSSPFNAPLCNNIIPQNCGLTSPTSQFVPEQYFSQPGEATSSLVTQQPVSDYDFTQQLFFDAGLCT